MLEDFFEDRPEHLGKPLRRKIFAVGDIHGCSSKLSTLLKSLPLDPDRDLVVFLGDYINRGPGSREVIEILIDLSQRVENAVFLMGNHEYAVLEYARTCDPEDLRLLRPLGIEDTLKSYGELSIRALRDLSFLPESHRFFLEGLVPYFRTKNYLFTHAGVIPGESIENCSPDRLLNVRSIFLEYEETESHGPVVVFGHTPFETPFLTRRKIGIDTGAVYGNLLTAVELPAVRFYHA
jgi:serine/threonine protein phosphatase 1